MRVQEQVIETVRELLVRRKKTAVEIVLESPLYAEGLGLDSLDAAELSAQLEDRFGRDPYSEGVVPQTVGDIVGYYER